MLGEVVGRKVVSYVASELSVGLVVVAPHGRLLERAYHPLRLAVSPWMVGSGQAVLDAMSSAQSPEGVRESVTARLASIGELDEVRNCADQRLEERDGGEGGGSAVEAGEGELGGAVYCDEQVRLALLGANLANVYVEVADP